LPEQTRRIFGALVPLFAEKMQNDLPPVGLAPMFEQIDPLPSAEHQPPRGNRDGKLGWRKRGPDMRGHVVWSFRLMNIALVVFWRDGLKKIFKISLNVWVGIFLNKERRRSVAAKYCQKAGRDILASQPKRNFAGDFDKTFASGLNVKRVQRLAH
jgi:hypothetical protein